MIRRGTGMFDIRTWGRAVAVAALFLFPFLAGATATQDYLAFVNGIAAGGAVSSCYSSMLNTQTPIASVFSTAEGCVSSHVQAVVCANQGGTNIYCTVGSWSGPASTDAVHYSENADITPNGGTSTITASFSCPNGGSLNLSWPGWCIINNQPPPIDKCRDKGGTSAGYWAIYDDQSSVVDSDGCEIEFSSVMCGPPSGTFAEPNCVAEGTYTGNNNPSQSNVAGDQNNSDQQCAFVGGGQICAGNNTSPGCGTVDGQAFCPPDVPNDSCVSTSNGGVICAGNAGTPPAPDNGTAGVPADPTTTVNVGSPGDYAGGGGSDFNYYPPSTVGTSTTGGSGSSGSTTGQTTQTAPASTQLAAIEGELTGIRSAVSQIAAQSAGTVIAPSVSTGGDPAGQTAASVSGDADAADINSSTEQAPFVMPVRSCSGTSFSYEGVTMNWNFCNIASEIAAALYWFFWGLTAWYAWATWQRTGIGRSD